MSEIHLDQTTLVVQSTKHGTGKLKKIMLTVDSIYHDVYVDVELTTKERDRLVDMLISEK
jgi:hypothetical protein